MLLEFFPENIRKYFIFDLSKLYEVRLRKNQDIIIFYDKSYVSLKDFIKSKDNIICTEKDIDYIIEYVTEKSIYAFNEEIKQGFLTYKSGIRIGLSGKVIMDCGQVKTITKISSLNVRIPHEIEGISNDLINKITSERKVRNTLIYSPPFLGKTTILKDIIRGLDSKFDYQILVIDERGEFENIYGKNIDKISYTTKDYAFTYSIRSMSPKIVICDEIYSKNDWEFLNNLTKTGVKVIASCHAENINDVKQKKYFNRNIFDLYIEISNQIGKIENIFNKNFQKIC